MRTAETTLPCGNGGSCLRRKLRSVVRLAVQVPLNHFSRLAVDDQFSGAEKQRFVAKVLYAGQFVTHEKDRASPISELSDTVHALALERYVANGKHFINQQNLRLDMDCDGE